ncbi:YdcF family protein [Microbacterium awajiense]|uniref:YdcF family protein n=1 Tax=Microbacterium awajiense TaxID=415214 RepID=A0ABP7AIB7_9MICO
MTRTRRRALAWLGAALTAIAVFVIAGLPLYVFPAPSDPHRADVVQVLGPATDERVDAALRLIDDGLASALLVSVAAPGEPASDLELCDREFVTCATPDPYTTDGETLLLEEYALSHDVHSAVVLTATGHVSRARFVYAKCYPGAATVVGVSTPSSLLDWAGVYVYQTAAFVKALVTPCAHPHDAR